MLVGPWLAAALALVWQHRRAPLTRFVALAWLPAGALWLLADRLGVRPLGFPSHLVALTAAHFHHAGFGVSALLASVGARRSVAVHQLGMVSVAAGLTVSYAADLGLTATRVPGARWLEPLGAACIVGTLVVWGRLAWCRRSVTSGWRRVAFSVAAVAWAYPMALALVWALAPLGPSALLEPLHRTLTAMVAQHGAVNALAVVLLGLAALTSQRTTATSAPTVAPTASDTFSPTEQGAH